MILKMEAERPEGCFSWTQRISSNPKISAGFDQILGLSETEIVIKSESQMRSQQFSFQHKSQRQKRSEAWELDKWTSDSRTSDSQDRSFFSKTNWICSNRDWIKICVEVCSDISKFRQGKISQRLFPVIIVYDIVVIALEIHGITLAGDNVLDNPLKIPPPS